MIRAIVGSSLIVFASCTFAQSAHLSFEAASLKPTASPSSPGPIMRRMSGGPGSNDPGRFTYTNVTLKLLVQMAYNLKEFQVEGPAWIDGEGYDLIATMPQGTTQEQAAQMMQTLLAERFKLQFRRETRQLPQFALVVGKGGCKMKEVETPAPLPEGPPAGGPQGFGRGPGIRMMMSPNGIRIAGPMTMAQLANALTRQLARPVLDQTELTQTYDVDITYMPDNMDGMRLGGGPGGPGGPGAGPGGPAGAGPGGLGGPEGPRNAQEPAVSLAQALQEKLGLKLDARKSPAEILTVDHAEKAPVEN
jgi:uncharacterized protein (TIGR03435 family)